MLSKQGNLGTLDDYALDLGTEGIDSQFGKGLISKEIISNGEESEDEIIKKNKEVYENLCKNWKTMSDKELDDTLNSLSETVRGYFILTLSEDELKEVLSKDTILTKDVTVYPVIDVDSYEDIANNTEDNSPKIKKYDMAYKYYIELAENLSASGTNRVWSTSGAFYFKFEKASPLSSDKTTYNGTSTISLTSISEPTAANHKGKITKKQISVTNKRAGLTLGTCYFVSQTYGTNNASSWSGIYINKMQFNKPAYHSISSVSNDATPVGRFDFNAYNKNGAVVNNDTLSSSEKALSASKTTIYVDFECNSYNCGLDTAMGGKRTKTITFSRPQKLVSYDMNFSGDVPDGSFVNAQ